MVDRATLERWLALLEDLMGCMFTVDDRYWSLRDELADAVRKAKEETDDA